MKNRMKSGVFLLLFLLPVCFLSGCQLAINDDTTAHNSERLIGVFVTIGLDTSKLYEEQLKNTEFKVNSQGKLEVKTMGSASMSMEGTITGDGHVIFGNYQGYYIGEGEITDDSGKKQPVNFADPGFYDVKCAYNDKDGEKDSSFEGTLALSLNNEKAIHINPVYQRSDGSIYAILGQGMGYMNTGTSSGMIYSQTLENKNTTSNGHSVKTEKTSFKVNIAIIEEAKQLLIKEMNQSDELIKTTEYYPDSPEEYIVDSKTTYIIVEEWNNKQTRKVTRYIYNLENIDLEDNYVSHTCHFPGKDGIIGVKAVRFVTQKHQNKK